VKLTDVQKNQVRDLLVRVQKDLTAKLAAVDGAAQFEFKPWQRAEGGGGTMSVMRGQVVEKAGVNYSEVTGSDYPAIESEHKGKPFLATGVSTITHMFNPYAPIGHMNVRLLEVGDTFWVGGGADLTPFKPFAEDTAEFHGALENACKKFSSEAYEKYRKWCDEYFFIKHRNSVRGVGGIFFDYLKGDFDQLFTFISDVAFAYVNTFPKILERRKGHSFTENEKDEQLYWRGRYAEFNLVYDRGTKFGLMTGGNIEAIFVSMPPVVKW